jgi:hypothetical protein
LRDNSGLHELVAESSVELAAHAHGRDPENYDAAGNNNTDNDQYEKPVHFSFSFFDLFFIKLKGF